MSVQVGLAVIGGEAGKIDQVCRSYRPGNGFALLAYLIVFKRMNLIIRWSVPPFLTLLINAPYVN